MRANTIIYTWLSDRLSDVQRRSDNDDDDDEYDA
jgi:hypothetical protein